MKLPLCELVSV